jgi:hypothetical protein
MAVVSFNDDIHQTNHPAGKPVDIKGSGMGVVILDTHQHLSYGHRFGYP